MQILQHFKTDRIQRYVARFLRFTLFAASVIGFVHAQWEIAIISLIIFIVTLIPIFVERQYKIYLPAEFELAIVIFIYATLYLGEVQHYYLRFWWWDIMLHGGSAIGIGFIGFMILYILYYNHRIEAKPIWFAVFAFCFALSIGAMWEIFEFGMDQSLGTNMQKSGLVDTMTDLIVDAAGALITSVVGFIYLKRRRHSLFAVILGRFLDKNPQYQAKLIDYKPAIPPK